LQYKVVLIFIRAVIFGMFHFALGAETVTCRPQYACRFS